MKSEKKKELEQRTAQENTYTADFLNRPFEQKR